MASPARKFEPENDMETRVTRLEVKTEHIESTLVDMKGRIGRIEDKLDAVEESVAALRVEMKDSNAAMKDAISALDGRMKDSFAALDARMRDSFEKLNVGRALDKVWALLTVAALLGVMARGFSWI